MRRDMFISHIRLIRLTDHFDGEVPHMHFPVKTLNAVLFTYALMVFATVFLWFRVFVIVAVFSCIMTLIYGWLMVRFWGILRLSRLKCAVLALLLWPAVGAVAVGLRSLMFPAVNALLNLIYSLF